MNNEPVAWINKKDGNSFVDWDKDLYSQEHIPLYTHPHPDNLGLAESIIKQQELRIVELEKQLEDAKDEMAMWQMSYENCHRMCNGYGMN
jgi:hypothetical protein